MLVLEKRWFISKKIFIYIDYSYFLPAKIIRNATVAVLASVGFLEFFIEIIPQIAEITVASILFVNISIRKTRLKQIKV